MKQNFILLLILAIGLYIHFSNRPILHGPGVKAPEEPRQVLLENGKPIYFKGYKIKPLASFNMKGRVLRKKRYFFGEESKLSPYDLAMGWGAMSDEKILKDVKITQTGRFYYWHVDSFPIPRREIEKHSANMHMIPKNNEILKKLKSIRKGNIIVIKGDLVLVTKGKSWRWKSSLTRNDVGGGACEIIYIRDLKIIA